MTRFLLFLESFLKNLSYDTTFGSNGVVGDLD
jgi:hypothetical protein